jgi:hypothetical protein
MKRNLPRGSLHGCGKMRARRDLWRRRQEAVFPNARTLFSSSAAAPLLELAPVSVFLQIPKLRGDRGLGKKRGLVEACATRRRACTRGSFRSAGRVFSHLAAVRTLGRRRSVLSAPASFFRVRSRNGAGRSGLRFRELRPAESEHLERNIAPQFTDLAGVNDLTPREAQRSSCDSR